MRFKALNDGTVLDTQTNLMGATEDNKSDISWVDAKIYCKNYRGGGYKDWRMLSQDELMTLYDSSKSRHFLNRFCEELFCQIRNHPNHKRECFHHFYRQLLKQDVR
jgi:hypothetical protein